MINDGEDMRLRAQRLNAMAHLDELTDPNIETARSLRGYYYGF
jgi:hypothetical protein